MWHLHLESVAVNSLSVPMKQTITKLKNHKSTTEIAETLGVAKPTVWYILKKKEHRGGLKNTARPRRP